MRIEPDQLAAAAGAGHLGPAVVLGPMMADRRLPILLEDAAGRTATATVPELPVPDPQTGDVVLVGGQEARGLFVLGVVSRREADATSTVRLQTGDGSRVEVDQAGARSEIRVYSRRGDLLLQYEPHADRARVDLQADDLELAVPGRLTLAARESIRLAAPDIQAQASGQVRLGAGDRTAGTGARLDLQRGSARLDAAEVAIAARTGRFEIDEATYRGRRLDAALQWTRLVTGRLETVAQTVVSRAGNVYRTVEHLVQLRAGRVRTIVQAAYHLKARRAYIKASEDVNLDGEKINLG